MSPRNTIRILSSLLTFSIIIIIGLTTQPSQDLHNQNEFSTKNTEYNVCFTPNLLCLKMILREIANAQKEILVQAYSFTDPDIGEALVKAKIRDVKVKIILDKSNKKDQRSQRSFVMTSAIPVAIDPSSGIAHNKVMIIDEKTVITGSYNFSKNAYTRNAENVLVIRDAHIASLYKGNWEKRWNLSTPIAMAPITQCRFNNEP